MNIYKRDEKISNDTIFTQKLNYSFMYTFIQKTGEFIRRISTKDATKHIYKITIFWHLSNSPQLETLFVLKQSQVNLNKQNMIIKESRINKFLKQKTNVWVKRKRTRQNTNLPQYYN